MFGCEEKDPLYKENNFNSKEKDIGHEEKNLDCEESLSSEEEEEDNQQVGTSSSCNWKSSEEEDSQQVGTSSSYNWKEQFIKFLDKLKLEYSHQSKQKLNKNLPKVTNDKIIENTLEFLQGLREQTQGCDSHAKAVKLLKKIIHGSKIYFDNSCSAKLLQYITQEKKYLCDILKQDIEIDISDIDAHSEILLVYSIDILEYLLSSGVKLNYRSGDIFRILKTATFYGTDIFKYSSLMGYVFSKVDDEFYKTHTKLLDEIIHLYSKYIDSKYIDSYIAEVCFMQKIILTIIYVLITILYDHNNVFMAHIGEDEFTQIYLSYIMQNTIKILKTYDITVTKNHENKISNFLQLTLKALMDNNQFIQPDVNSIMQIIARTSKVHNLEVKQPHKAVIFDFLQIKHTIQKCNRHSVPNTNLYEIDECVDVQESAYCLDYSYSAPSETLNDAVAFSDMQESEHYLD